MSKSLGNFIPPQEIVDKYGVDSVRYFMLRELPFGNDGDFSHRAMVHRLNSDLANDLGNLVQRVLSMINRNCAEQIPDPGALHDDDTKLLDASEALLATIREIMSRQEIHLALEEIWRVIADANRYVDAMAPWELRKSDPDRMASVLFTLAETIRRIAIMVQPFVPGRRRSHTRSVGGGRGGSFVRNDSRRAQADRWYAVAETRRRIPALRRRSAVASNLGVGADHAGG